MTDTPVTAKTPEDAPQGGITRVQQIVVALTVALVIVAGAVWLAQSQGADSLGQGGVHSSLLPRVGEPAPEFMTLYADGEVFRLSDLQGQPVWLNFWGSWCPPCRSEMPELQEAWTTLEPQGVLMVGIAMREDPRDAVVYADRVGATFPVAVDPNYLAAVADREAIPELFDTAETWDIRNYPTHVFIDAEGIVRAVYLQQLTTDTAVAEGEALLERASLPKRTPTTCGQQHAIDTQRSSALHMPRGYSDDLFPLSRGSPAGHWQCWFHPSR